MIAGRVTGLLEAVIPLTIIGAGDCRVDIEAVIVTGFNGFLTLEFPVVRALRLPPAGSRRATLADGSTISLNVYLASLQWHGAVLEALVIEADGGPLAGMSLLQGSSVTLDVVAGGGVQIAPLGNAAR
jgi:clan AA aspartic protease